MKTCFRVPILLNILLFTEFRISSEGREFSSLSHYCQWGPSRHPSSHRCAEKRCALSEGFIIPGTNQLVCFNHSKKSSVVLIKDEEKNYVKQCGYKTSLDRPCNPPITCENLTEEECSIKCSEYTVYISRTVDRINEDIVSNCGETSEIEPRTRTLDGSGNYHYVEREDGALNTVFNCSCGFGEKGKEQTKPRRQRGFIPNEDAPDEMAVSCPIVLLEKDKGQCRGKCKNLKGIYSREDKKFICFNSERKVAMIEATAGYCLCGVAKYGDRKKLNYNGECPPERKIKSNNIDDCPKRCENYKAYVFTPKQGSTYTKVYCEYPSYTFEYLSYKIGKTVVVDNRDGNRKYRKYECTCGIRLSQLEIDSKLNLGELEESLSIKHGPNNVQNDTQIRNISDIHQNEKEVSDLQLSSELDIIQNEEIDDLLMGIDFLHDLIDDNENTLNSNNSIDLEIPNAGEKRKSQQMNSPEVEIHRGKIKVSNIEESAQPADFHMPSMMACHHTAWTNEDFVDVGSSSHEERLDSNVKQQYDEEMIPFIFVSGIPDLGPQILPLGDFYLPQMSRHHTLLQTNIIINDNLGSSSHNIELVRNSSPNMEIECGVSQNRGLIGNITSQPNMSQNQRLNRNDTSQNTGVINPNMRRSDDHNSLRNISAGTRYPSLWYEDNISHRSFPDSRSFTLPNARMKMNEPVGYNTSLNMGPSCNMSQYMKLIRNTSLDTGEYSNVIQNSEIINRNSSRGNDDYTLQDIPAGTGYPSFLDEGTMSPRSLPNSPSFLFPNATMEINEVLRPGR